MCVSTLALAVASTGSCGDEATKRTGKARAESGTGGAVTSPGGDEKGAVDFIWEESHGGARKAGRKPAGGMSGDIAC